ncbi:ribonuclease H [Desulfosarcina alkanivorans]|uniref:Ribonuclease H n=1 Tax=Desulfosarcina alkanivorans TaxID=571177 RepID=A0A5K7YEA0_9BACT|nr:ribonuclease HI [Desulfosarcina alkanivorans]BBO67398.1 ribonuclease H [Desulfosarcina alkanivorans]
MAEKKYYAVAVGRSPGVYTQWFGNTGAQAQVKGFQGARYKGFPTIEEARAFIRERQADIKKGAGCPKQTGKRPTSRRPPAPAVSLEGRIVIYTDGSSLGNPGPGGYGVVIPSPEERREFSGGFRKTTNNRMELLACIIGLEQLETPSAVAIYSDSRYVVDGITKGWAKKWRRNDWRKSTGDKALNIDLWERLLSLCERHDVMFVWVKGHAGNPGNERCDQLATQAAAQPNLPSDIEYEKVFSPAAGKRD